MARVRIRLARDELEKIAAQGAGKLVLSATRRTLNRARVLSPWDTGNLRASHTMTIKRLKKKRVVGRVSSRVNYALAVHEGTRPHVIRPKRKKALAFQRGGSVAGGGGARIRFGGRMVVVKKVNHPGTQPRPWLRQAMTEVAAQRGFTARATRPKPTDAAE